MEKEITSVNNEVVKNVAKLQQKKFRDETGKFLLEGFKVVDEAIKSGIQIEQIFVNQKNLPLISTFKRLICNKECNLDETEIICESCNRVSTEEKFETEAEIELILTTEAVLKKISSTDSAPDVVAVAKQKVFTVEDIKFSKKIVLLENIKDSGNLGTILRTAKAFSQDAVILFGDTVDLYNPKCVRSAVGNLWKLPVVHIKDFEVLKNNFSDYEKVATLPKSEKTVNLKEYKAKSPYIIMFGSEAEGLSQDLIDISDKKLTIEMNSEVESLNLSIAVGVMLYKLKD